jgi:hypothetical protein
MPQSAWSHAKLYAPGMSPALPASTGVMFAAATAASKALAIFGQSAVERAQNALPMKLATSTQASADGHVSATE